MFNKSLNLESFSIFFLIGISSKLLKINSGKLVPGFDANLVLVDTEETWTVNPEKFFSKGKSTPLEGKKLTGRVHATFYKGRQVFSLVKKS